MATATVPLLDEAVREYLLFRGFTQALRAFDKELEKDQTKGFQTDHLISKLLRCVEDSDLPTMLALWEQLDLRFFSRLDHSFQNTTHTLETGLRRLWLVRAIQNKRQDMVAQFFQQLTPELRGRSEWNDWFTLPYVENPEAKQPFAMYFQATWRDIFAMSLANFMATVHQHLPKPFLMRYEEQFNEISRLQQHRSSLTREPLSAAMEPLEHRTASPPSSSPRMAPADVPSPLSSSHESPEKPSIQVVDSPGASPEQTRPQPAPLTWAASMDTADKIDKVDKLEDRNLVSPRRQGSFRLKREPFLVLSSEAYQGHASPVMAVAKAPDRPVVLSFDQSNVVRLWDSSSLATLHTLTPSQAVVSLCWAPSSERIFYLGFVNATLWQITSTHVQEPKEASVTKLTKLTAMACAPNNTILACLGVSSEGRCHSVAVVDVVDLSTKLHVNLPAEHTATCISFSNSLMVAVGTKQGHVVICDIKDGKLIMDLSTHSYPVCAIRFTSDLSNFLSLDQQGLLLHTFGARLHDPPTAVCQLGSVTRTSDKFDNEDKQSYDTGHALALDSHDQHVVLAVEAEAKGALLVGVDSGTENADMTIGSAHGLAVSVSWAQDVILTGHDTGVVSVTNIVRV
eukprot:m.175853 g.175853  ORF g.175853 m.175853 type:complete len:625 (-) comp16791_c0_seq8:2257-4131(-)